MQEDVQKEWSLPERAQEIQKLAKAVRFEVVRDLKMEIRDRALDEKSAEFLMQLDYVEEASRLFNARHIDSKTAAKRFAPAVPVLVDIFCSCFSDEVPPSFSAVIQQSKAHHDSPNAIADLINVYHQVEEHLDYEPASAKGTMELISKLLEHTSEFCSQVKQAPEKIKGYYTGKE